MRHVVNFTDVDDKTIAGAQREGVSLREYTDRYIAAFYEDAAALGLERVEEMPRATDPRQSRRDGGDDQGARGQRGHTYVSDGSIYFKIATMPDYGKLARLDHEGMQAGARVDSDNYAKEDARDFVLWKATKPGEPTWDVGVGPRPARLAHRVLGDGAAAARRGADRHSHRRHRPDLPAPRERDRAERVRDGEAVLALLGARRASAGRRPEDVEVARQRLHAEGHRRARAPLVGAALPAASSHYRKQLNFTWRGSSRPKSRSRGSPIVSRGSRPCRPASAHPAHCRRAWPRRARRSTRRCSSDLNTSAGLAAMFDLVRVVNTAIDAREMSAADAAAVATRFAHFDRCSASSRSAAPRTSGRRCRVEEIERLIEARKDARRRRDFAEADRHPPGSRQPRRRCSRTARRARGGSGSEELRRGWWQVNGHRCNPSQSAQSPTLPYQPAPAHTCPKIDPMPVPDLKTPLPGPRARRSSSATLPSCRRPTRAPIPS